MKRLVLSLLFDDLACGDRSGGRADGRKRRRHARCDIRLRGAEERLTRVSVIAVKLIRGRRGWRPSLGFGLAYEVSARDGQGPYASSGSMPAGAEQAERQQGTEAQGENSRITSLALHWYPGDDAFVRIGRSFLCWPHVFTDGLVLLW